MHTRACTHHTHSRKRSKITRVVDKVVVDGRRGLKFVQDMETRVYRLPPILTLHVAALDGLEGKGGCVWWQL